MIKENLSIITEKTQNTEFMQLRILLFKLTIVVRKDSSVPLTPLAGHCKQ